MKRNSETYWGRFSVNIGISTAGSAQNIMLRALDKKAAKVSNFQLPANHFAGMDIESIEYADAWCDSETVEVDLELKSGKIVELTFRR